MKIEPEVAVPCDGCTACCRGRAIRPLYPERGDVVETYVHQYVEDVPALAWNSNGDCIYVSPEGCTIHARRPALCRGYDCRVAYLALTRRQRRARHKGEAIPEGNLRCRKETLREGYYRMNRIIRIVCDGKNGRFKHVEDAQFQRVDAGQWHEREDGLWEKRIITTRVQASDGSWEEK